MPVATRSRLKASSSSPSPPSSESVMDRFRFLDLPPEIRDQIYRELVSSDVNRRVSNEGVATYDFHLNIFRTCKQVYEEARNVWRLTNVVICVETPWKQAEQHVADEGFIPLIAIGEKTRYFAPYHLHAVVEVPEMGYEPASSFVLLLQDLPAFTQMWYYSDLTHAGLNGHLSLDLKLGRVRRKDRALVSADEPTTEPCDQLLPALQHKLLTPFGKVKGTGTLQFYNTHPDLEAEVRDYMAVPYPTPEQCLDETTRLRALGNKAVAANNPTQAVDLYIQAFHAMHIVVAGRRRSIYADAYFEKDLVGGLHDGEFGGIVRMTLRVRLVADIMAALMRLERWEDVYFWGYRSINLMRDGLGPAADEPRENFPAPESYGMIYFRTAVAAGQLGDLEHYNEFLRIGRAWLPNDPVVRQEVALNAARG